MTHKDSAAKGITIHYRGRLADPTRVEDFEDRLFDPALGMGGQARIWRSYADQDPQRVVRGVIVNLAPGQESTSLLLAPESWLIGLTDIEDAELGRLTEPPRCFTKTQFGSLEDHVALVEMFTVLRREFLPDLEVSDEGGYWETRDHAELARKHSLLQGDFLRGGAPVRTVRRSAPSRRRWRKVLVQQTFRRQRAPMSAEPTVRACTPPRTLLLRKSLLQAAIDGISEGLQRHSLSPEAAEDPEILSRRIERIAAQVHRILRRPSEHPPVEFPDGSSGDVPNPEATKTLWDELYKHNRRQQERLHRALEERRSRGEEDDGAHENALKDLGLEIPSEESCSNDEPWRDEDQESFVAPLDDECVPEPADGDDSATENVPFPADEERHPLLERAMALLKDLHTLFRDEDPRLASSLGTLFQGAGDAMGGLAQALSGHEHEVEDHGLRVTQLKRALRGLTFARGALSSLRGTVTVAQSDDLVRVLRELEQDIFLELTRVRSELEADDS